MGPYAEPMVNENRDEETGQYEQRYSAEDFLAVIDGTTTTAEVAGAIGCDHDTAYRRLSRLAEEGAVDRQLIGNTLVWSVPDNTGDGG